MEPFELFLNEEPKETRITMVLGSGFHSYALGNGSVLSNWELLLRKIHPAVSLTDHFTLDFERMLVNLTNKQSKVAAADMEKEILMLARSIISEEQERILSQKELKHPQWLFNPNMVSDVVSLNFDTVAQTLCERQACKTAEEEEHKVKTSSGMLSVKSYRIEFPNKKDIRFWYPHGSIQDSTATVLGTRKYSENVRLVESYRKHSKKEDDRLTSWYSQMVDNPILIIGASISAMEWDIWSAFVNRERNLAKSKNLKYRQPIFQMREEQHATPVQLQWFQPLFVGLAFDEQWERLEMLIRSRCSAAVN